MENNNQISVVTYVFYLSQKEGIWNGLALDNGRNFCVWLNGNLLARKKVYFLFKY